VIGRQLLDGHFQYSQSTEFPADVSAKSIISNCTASTNWRNGQAFNP